MIDTFAHAALLRYAALAAVVAWAFLAGRGSRWGAVLGGALVLDLVVAFWIGGMGRPYGLLVDPQETLRACGVAVAAESPHGDGAVLAGDPTGATAWTRIASSRLPADVLVRVPTLLPLALLPALLVLVALLGADALAASVLWLAFVTTDLEALRGAGLLPGLWARPGPALAVAGVLAVAAALQRRGPVLVVGVVAAALAAAVAFRGDGIGPGPTLLLLTFDQVPWLLLAGFALRRGLAPLAAIALAGSGAALLLASACGLPLDPWGPHALYRTGLLLAGSGAVAAGLRAIAPRVGGIARARALLVLVLVPGSFPLWWSPVRFDPVVDASAAPVPAAIEEAMSWTRASTPRDAVFAASPYYASAVCAIGGRHVLRAPLLITPDDDTRRVHAEKLLLTGRDGTLARRYGVTHVMVARGDFREYGLGEPDALRGQPGFAQVWTDGTFSIYRVDASGVEPPAPVE